MTMNLESDLTTFLQDLIHIHALPEQEFEIGSRVLLELEKLGFDAALRDEHGNVFGVVRGLEPGPAWLLITHLDHVHEGDLSLWSHPPYEAVLEDGFVHGRGAVDIKGPLSAQVYALGELLSRGERPKNDVVVAAFVQEETGGYGIARFMESLDEQHRPRAGSVLEGQISSLGQALVGEPSSNTVMLGHRGVCNVEMVFHGVAHHASLGLNDQNPMFGLAKVLAQLEHQDLPTHPVVGRSSLTPSQVWCDSGSQNLTSNTVTLMLDWRFTESEADKKALLEALLKGVNATYVLHPLWTVQNTPGFWIEPQHTLVQKLLEHAPNKQAGIWKFATDGRYTFRGGIPSVGYGPGDSSLAHTTREKVSVSELVEHVQVLQSLLTDERGQTSDDRHQKNQGSEI